MFYLKFYKPLIAINMLLKSKNNNINIKHKKLKSNLYLIKNTQDVFYVHNRKICFFTFKYKTQLNILKQSRFKLQKDLTFNKNHSWSKYTH